MRGIRLTGAPLQNRPQQRQALLGERRQHAPKGPADMPFQGDFLVAQTIAKPKWTLLSPFQVALEHRFGAISQQILVNP